MTIRVAIAGATGYVGGELLRMLLTHPEVEIGELTAAASAGSRLGEHHPQLVPLADRVVAQTSVTTLRDHDAVFLALPHGTSASLAEQLDSQTLVVDCGADFRLQNEQDWVEFYGGDFAGTWPYGLPELPGQREVLGGARRIAGPGCFPTVSTLAILPALGFINTSDITIVAPTAPSGAGKKLSPTFLAAEVLGQASAYGVGGTHRHTPEIEQNLRMAGAQDARVSFTPVLVPMSRGILSVVSAPALPGLDAAQLREAYQRSYHREPFVHLLPAGQWPQTQATVGANTVHLQVALDSRADRVVAIAAMDNLAKGTAGGAIQSMNIALGWEETLGLSTIGIAP